MEHFKKYRLYETIDLLVRNTNTKQHRGDNAGERHFASIVGRHFQKFAFTIIAIFHIFAAVFIVALTGIATTIHLVYTVYIEVDCSTQIQPKKRRKSHTHTHIIIQNSERNEQLAFISF